MGKNSFPSYGSVKRPRVVSPVDLGLPQYFEKFFVVSRKEGSFEKVSPFLIYRFFVDSVGELKDVKKLRSGELLVEVDSFAQAKKISSLSLVGDMEIIVKPHGSLNVVKGVITCRDLLCCSSEEILEGLGSQGVVEVRRINSRVDGVLTPTATLILTFKSHSLPETVKAGFIRIKVRPYIPNPLRCFNCQRFGHTSDRCKFDAACPRCGKDSHNDSQCNPPPSCVNCNESHSPRYKGCAVFKFELGIQKLKTLERLSYVEAKKKFISLNPIYSKSYAEKVNESSFSFSAVKSSSSVIPMSVSSSPASKPHVYSSSLPSAPSPKSQLSSLPSSPVPLPIPSLPISLPKPHTSGNRGPVTPSKKPPASISTKPPIKNINSKNKKSSSRSSSENSLNGAMSKSLTSNPSKSSS